MIHSQQLHGHVSREQEYLEGWQRSRAELANYQKRLKEQQEQVVLRAKQAALIPFLSVADNFRAMVRHVPADRTDDAWTQGVMHIARQVEQLLIDQGVEIINDVSETYSPHRHEVVDHVTSTQANQKGKIVEIIQVGYRFGHTVLRPAKVKVAS